MALAIFSEERRTWWTLAAVSLSFAALMLIGGKLADAYAACDGKGTSPAAAPGTFVEASCHWATLRET